MTIHAWGATEVARVTCDQVTTTKGAVLDVNREFVMTSDGRILTRDLDSPGYRVTARYVPASERNLAGLLEYVNANHYRAGS